MIKLWFALMARSIHSSVNDILYFKSVENVLFCACTVPGLHYEVNIFNRKIESKTNTTGWRANWCFTTTITGSVFSAEVVCDCILLRRKQLRVSFNSEKHVLLVIPSDGHSVFRVNVRWREMLSTCFTICIIFW